MPRFGTAVKCVLRTSFHHRSQMLRAALYSTKVVDCRLEALIPESARERGVETRREVVEHDEPAAGICRAAERFNADLICMESRGRSRFKEAILGSVSQEVMRRSNRPVLVMPGASRAG